MTAEELFYYNCHNCGNEGFSRQKQQYVCDFCLQSGHEDNINCELCKKNLFKEYLG